MKLTRQALSLPNLLTYLRVLAIPLVLATMQSDSPRNAFAAAMIFAAASATDALDGYLARKYNLTSVIGKFLDPLADKLIVLGALIMLLYLGRVNVWIVFVILAREIIINGLRTIALTEGLVIAARDLGKYKTALQMVGIWALLIHYPHTVASNEPAVDFHRLGSYFLYISVFFSLISAYDYFRSFVLTVLAHEAKDAAREPVVSDGGTNLGAQIDSRGPG
jgi:CDP-diacylglycerol--glycerol-3-phosphate 3-phosphatidyltransferase